MFGQEFAEFVHYRKDRFRAAIHDGAAADFHDLKPGEDLDRATASDGAGEFAVEEGLARERRGDVFDVVGVVGHDSRFQLAVMMVPTCSPASAGQIAGDKAVHDLHLADVARRLEQVEHRELEDRVPAVPAFISSTEIFGMNAALFEVFGFSV